MNNMNTKHDEAHWLSRCRHCERLNIYHKLIGTVGGISVYECDKAEQFEDIDEQSS